MKRKQLELLCAQRLDPDRYVLLERTTFVTDGWMHRQVCRVKWANQFTEKVTPRVVSDLLKKLRKQEDTIKHLEEDLAALFENGAEMP